MIVRSFRCWSDACFYVLLDGYYLGAGAVHLFVAVTTPSAPRRTGQASGPYWNGKRSGSSPRAERCSALSTVTLVVQRFYLPFMVLLWLLMFRGIASMPESSERPVRRILRCDV